MLCFPVMAMMRNNRTVVVSYVVDVLGGAAFRSIGLFYDADGNLVSLGPWP